MPEHANGDLCTAGCTKLRSNGPTVSFNSEVELYGLARSFISRLGLSRDCAACPFSSSLPSSCSAPAAVQWCCVSRIWPSLHTLLVFSQKLIKSVISLFYQGHLNSVLFRGGNSHGRIECPCCLSCLNPAHVPMIQQWVTGFLYGLFLFSSTNLAFQYMLLAVVMARRNIRFLGHW